MTTQLTRMAQVCSMLLSLAACGDGDDLPERPLGDSGMLDAGSWDAGPLDARVPEAGGPATPTGSH